MATKLFSQLRTQSQITVCAVVLPRRGFHTELGARENALLAEDLALKMFKSHKKDVRRIKKVGDLLTVVVVADKFFYFPYYNLYKTFCYLLQFSTVAGIW